MSALALWRPAVNAVYEWDALGFLRQMETGSVNLIACDPPYMGVKDAAWDNQWATDGAYLDWLRDHLREMRRVLAPNGSLYLFASPRMAARVEIAVGEYFNVLNRITWSKPRFATKAEMFDKDTMRGFFPSSEAIIFAEQYGSDEHASDEAKYHELYEEAKRQKRHRILGDYLVLEFNRANVTRKQVAALFPSATGGFTGCVSNWVLGHNVPTSDQYQKMRDLLNAQGGSYLERSYAEIQEQCDDVRREYEALRHQYDSQKRDYEANRRPFNASPFAPYTDVWTFATVQHYDGKHECEKPLALMRHIVTMSSRPGDVVLDCFCGSGATLDAARREGRRYIGCDMSAHWAAYARKRVALPFTLGLWDTAATRDDVRGA